jgi:BlaI family transcriptional regulator, penicillinase repressor
MSKKPQLRPTNSELEILGILWSHGPSSVRYVNEELSVKRRIGYTTTLKLMQIMTEKGFLSREKDSRNHIYFPLIREEETKDAIIQRFIDNLFEGSAAKLIMQALGNHKASKAELDMIKELIKEKEGGAR